MEEKNWHDKYYKLMLLLPLILFIFAAGYMIHFHNTTGDFIYKDISLTGGTTVTIYDNLDLNQIKTDLGAQLPELNVRGIYDLTTGEEKAIIIETTLTGEETKQILENYLGYTLTEGQNSDFEFTGSTLSSSFYKQLLFAVLLAFVLMAIVVFILFRTFIPSTAVILCAFADIFMTLVTVNLLGMKMSTAGIVAFLMLIGYSVDTDILLTTRMLKRTEGTLNKRIFDAFKTGLTMSLTSFFAFVCALLIVRSFSETLTQIFTILVIGLLFDILNTWVTNVSLLKWYVERRKK